MRAGIFLHYRSRVAVKDILSYDSSQGTPNVMWVCKIRKTPFPEYIFEKLHYEMYIEEEKKTANILVKFW